MNCAEIEELICEYVDGALTADCKAEVDRHLDACPACAELARDSAAALAFMERAAAVEPPPELITRILFDAPWLHGSPHGKPQSLPQQAPSKLRKWFGNLISPLLQPRLAMGMAMTILSFSILSRFVPIQQLHPGDLKPAEVWAGLDDRAHRAYARTVKYYENLKVVYQIQTLLRDWQQQAEEQQAVKASEPKTDDRKLPVKAVNPDGTPKSNPSGGPR
jgi:anti-sigma factor RsiW